MSIKRTVGAIALAVSITLSGAEAVHTAFAATESGATAQSGQSARPDDRGRLTGRTESRKQLRGEYDGMWIDYANFDVLMVTRIDFDSPFGASYAVSMMVDGSLLEDAGFEMEGTFRIRGVEGCDGIRVSSDGVMLYMAVCVDGDYVTMIGGTDKGVVLDVAGDIQDGYEPTVPAGYEAQEN